VGKEVLPTLASQSEPSLHFEPFLHLHDDLLNGVERKPVEKQHITSCYLHSRPYAPLGAIRTDDLHSHNRNIFATLFLINSLKLNNQQGVAVCISFDFI